MQSLGIVSRHERASDLNLVFNHERKRLMRNSSQLIRSGLIALVTVLSLSAQAAQKEWTMLVFLNGNNNLDSFGTTNLKQMETVGSTGDINVVVQWASEATDTTKRMLIQKSTGGGVSSPVVQSLPRIDMGDYQQLVEFVRWGVANYPAKHYFIDIWNHGGGWHRSANGGMLLKPLDISYDELSGHSITTPQLGMALAEAAKIIGHKVDLYASDACLMAMGEIAFEVADSVEVFAGSEETEPGRGWPYDTFLKRWIKNAKASAVEVGKMLTEEYTQSYIDQHDGDVTYSVFDLSKIDQLVTSVKAMATSIAKLSPSDARTMATAAGRAQGFAYSDYVDFGDFLAQAQATRSNAIPTDVLNNAKSALSNVVIEAKNTSRYSKATGLSLWIPLESYTYSEHSEKYCELKFDKATSWGDAVKNLSSNAR